MHQRPNFGLPVRRKLGEVTNPIHLMLVRVVPGEHGCAGGSALGQRHVGAGEPETVGRQTIESGCAGGSAAIRTQRIALELVHQDDEDVWTTRRYATAPDSESVADSLPNEVDVGLRNGWRIATLDLVSTLGFWLVVGLLAILEATIVATALRMRVRTSGPLSIVGRRPAEIVWTLLPALLLVALVWHSLQPQ